MFRDILILTLAGFCLSAVTLTNAEIANKEFLEKQEKVYNLFWEIAHPEFQPDIYELGKSYKYEDHVDSYKNKDAFYEFLVMFKDRVIIPRGKLFSIFYPEHLHEAIVLFKTFYFAKDFETFYKTAAFAKNFMNEGVYAYALSLAVVHRPDTKYIRIPYLHELYPFIFFNTEAILSAYEAKFYPGERSTEGPIIIPSNYSALYSKYASQDDFKLMYFTEDVFLNEMEYYAHLAHPFWMSSKDFNVQSERRGEMYLYAWRMAFARYELERFSNDLYEVPEFDWHYPIPRGYYPSLSYHNGLPVPHREPHATIPSYKFTAIRELRDLEYKIQAVIDSGYVFYNNGSFESIRTPYGLDVFGNLLAGNADSPNHHFYGHFEALARDVLGFSPPPRNKYDVVPSVLQHYGADHRDPMYWSFAKRMVQYYKEFANTILPKYTFDELIYSNVNIEYVGIDHVETFFETFDYTIASRPKSGKVDHETLIKARQYRLNYKPFSFNITVASQKAETAFVRVFLGPKHDEAFDLAENFYQYIPLDEFMFELKAGSNVIVRHSAEFNSVQPELKTSDVYYDEIEKAISGGAAYEIPKRLYSYPKHTIIPKGKSEGYPYQLFFFITPYNSEESFEVKSNVFGDFKIPKVALGYPLDRPLYFPIERLPNAFFKEFYIYHKESSKHSY